MAACNVLQGAGEEQSQEVNAELLEAHIVAQAITELQEVQAPTGQVTVSTDNNGAEIQGEGNLSEQTHVIYYIEDGTIARTVDRTLVDSSVQANDYDIERRSGRLPARKRVIPVKFRDYKNTSNDEDSDSDFDPHDYVAKFNKKSKIIHTDSTDEASSNTTTTPRSDRTRRVGRPRKNFYPIQSQALQTGDNEDIAMELERKYQEAIEVSIATIEKTMPGSVTGVNNDRQTEDEEQTVSETTTDTETRVVEDGKVISAVNDKSMTTRTKSGTIARNTYTDTEKASHLALSGKGRGRPRLTHLPYYTCGECGKTFKQKGNLKTHLRLHVVGCMFFCQEEGCTKAYRSNESLRRHILTHQGIKPFPCDICEKSFSSHVALTEHRSRHLDEKPYQCTECNKCFRQISCYRRHIITHSADQPFSCPVCQKRFAQSAYLKSHIKVHTGEKPYQCNVCGKRFAYQSDVKRHSATHTGEKKYGCSKCPARFSDVSSKNRHEREHDNHKRYTCNLCHDTFKRQGQLTSHLSKKHSHAFAVKIERDPNNGALSFKLDESMENSANSNSAQQRIVSLIKNLHSKASEGFIELPPSSMSEGIEQSADISMATDNVTDISQLEKEVDVSIIEGDIRVPIELRGVEIQGEDSGQTFIAITDLADTLGSGDQQSEEQMQYRVLYETDENGHQKQILVPYNPAEGEDVQLEYSSESVVNSVQEVTTATETIIESSMSVIEEDTIIENCETTTESIQEQAETPSNQTDIEQQTETIETVAKESNSDVSVDKTDTSVAGSMNFVSSPDFSKQEYYNWLTNFTEYCKLVPMPLDVSLFQKISQVHKTLSDVMATPSGVVADKQNFRVLMNISRELSAIINEHLVFVMENLNQPEQIAEDTTVPCSNL